MDPTNLLFYAPSSEEDSSFHKGPKSSQFRASSRTAVFKVYGSPGDGLRRANNGTYREDSRGLDNSLSGGRACLCL